MDANVPVPNTADVFVALVGRSIVGAYLKQTNTPNVNCLILALDDGRALCVDSQLHFRLMPVAELEADITKREAALEAVAGGLDVVKAVRESIERAKPAPARGSVAASGRRMRGRR